MAKVIKEFHVEQCNTTIEVTAYFSKDRYGADADGNRWEWRYNLDATDYVIPDKKDNGDRLTVSEKLECEIELQKQLENHHWEVE